MKKEPSFLPFNFGALEEKFSSLETSRVVILPVPYDSTASFQSGSKDGPLAIISASRNMELFDEELGFSPHTFGIHTLPFLEPVVSSPDDMVNEVTVALGRYLKLGKFVVLLGGDHILSVGAVRAVKKKHSSLGIVQLDAHADLRNSYEGTRMNHACTGRRLMELGPLLQVGIRSMSERENEFLQRRDRGLKTGRRSSINARRLTTAGNSAGLVSLSPARTREFTKALAGLPDDVYLTIDMDVFDPSFVPSVGTPEPGGLSWNEVVGLMKELAARKRVVGIDVSELRPIPGFVAPDFLAARLIYRLIGSFLRTSQ
jgi:agmatinase